MQLLESRGSFFSILWATGGCLCLLSALSVLLFVPASAEPLPLVPVTDLPVTDLVSWSQSFCGSRGATCEVAGGECEDIESLCVEHGMKPRAAVSSASVQRSGQVIVDSFMFNNELDLLLIRLCELAPVVDYFVLVEANVSLSGMRKPALFAQHAHLFRAFAPQLLHVQLGDADYAEATSAASVGKKAWAWEEYSRAAVARGLRRIEHMLQRNFTSFDVVLVSDVDEVPSRSFVHGLRLCEAPLPAKLGMMFFYYSLRYRAPAHV
jgi:hypothetical protein